MGEAAEKLRYGFTGGSTRMEILGRDRVILEGCDGIIDYSKESIGLRCGHRQIWVNGRGLKIMCMDADSVVICGMIEGVCFR